MNKKLKEIHYGNSPNYYFSFNNVFKSNEESNNKNLLLNIDPKSSSYLKNYNTHNLKDYDSYNYTNSKNKLILKNCLNTL